MKISISRQFVLLILLPCFFLTTKANVSLPRLVSDGMILQRDIKIPVWGWASEGEKISINFQNRTFVTTCNKEGKWRINLPAYKSGGPFDMTIKGNNKIVIKDILIGDVWICSGQSNMAFKMEIVKDIYNGDIAKAANPNIRQFKVSQNTSFKVLDSLSTGEWKAADDRTVLNFSAAAYFFAVELYTKYRVPIGLINASVGGSQAKAWINLETVKKFPAYQKEYDRVCGIVAERGKTENLAAIVKSEKIKMAHVPANLFNAMLAPLIPYAIKGVIWYQGESEVLEAEVPQYQKVFSALVENWRSLWGQEKIPFLYVQLPNFKATVQEPGESKWAELREVQLKVLSVPNTGMAVTIDIREANSIHPKNKREVGKRLALVARKIVYGDKKVIYSGPVYRSMQVAGDKIILTFSDFGSSLIVKGGGDLKQFSIAGEDKKFLWAHAKIKGNKVVVWHDDVKSPVAVRYAWADNPEGSNLYNKEGLPASPFRTDDWPGMSYSDLGK